MEQREYYILKTVQLKPKTFTTEVIASNLLQLGQYMYTLAGKLSRPDPVENVKRISPSKLNLARIETCNLHLENQNGHL